MGKILILPDVHGRQFWKDACLNHKDEFEKIVFLGDYVAPYRYEGIGNEQAISVFKEVLDFKKDNADKVVLLFGNHDGSYLKDDICMSRTDQKNWDLLNGIYMDNLDLFDLAWETEIDGKRYFFSHAGVRKGSIVWADIREYGSEKDIEFPGVIFVCGHTQLENKPIIESWVADLDVRRPFVLDTETGKIEEYETRVDKKD